MKKDEITKENIRLKELLAEIKPQLQCRINSLTQCWPGPVISLELQRNVELMQKLDKAISRE